MSLTKQSKVLTKDQIATMSTFLRSKRNGLRNQTIFYLSVLSGLRSKEISLLSYKHILTPTNEIGNQINLTNDISKGNNGGRIIPIHSKLKVQSINKRCLLTQRVSVYN